MRRCAGCRGQASTAASLFCAADVFRGGRLPRQTSSAADVVCGGRPGRTPVPSVLGGVVSRAAGELGVVRPRAREAPQPRSAPLPCRPQHGPQGRRRPAADHEALAPERAGAVARRGTDRHLVVPHVEGGERAGERDAAVAEDPHGAAGVAHGALAHVDQLIAEGEAAARDVAAHRAERHPHRHVGAGLEARGHARRVHRGEIEQRSVEIGDRARRVERPPRGVGVAVEDELQHDPHAPSLAPRPRKPTARDPATAPSLEG